MGERKKSDRTVTAVVLAIIWVAWILFLFVMGTAAESAASKGSPAGTGLIFLSWICSFGASVLLIAFAIGYRSRRWGRVVMLTQFSLVISTFVALAVFSIHVSSIPYPFQAGGSYVNADLPNAHLKGDLCRANFSGANLSVCTGYGVNLAFSDLTSADLKGADLRQANLTGASLAYADLEGADLRQAELAGASLIHANCGHADLSGADLTGARLHCVSLFETKLVGVAGISDEVLAVALNASIDDLAFTLSQRGIRLESRESILEFLRDADFSLEGVDGAGAYTPDESFHPLMLLNEEGESYSWHDRIHKAGFEAMALRFCELVAFIGEEKAVAIETREYVWEYTGLPAPSITRYQYQMHIYLYSAKTGGIIAETTLRGSSPGPCPERASSSKTEIYGGLVNAEHVLAWIRDFVNPS